LTHFSYWEGYSGVHGTGYEKWASAGSHDLYRHAITAFVVRNAMHQDTAHVLK